MTGRRSEAFLACSGVGVPVIRRRRDRVFDVCTYDDEMRCMFPG